MSQNGRKMAKILHNAAKKFDWERTINTAYYSMVAIQSESIFTSLHLLLNSSINIVKSNIFFEMSNVKALTYENIKKFQEKMSSREGEMYMPKAKGLFAATVLMYSGRKKATIGILHSLLEYCRAFCNMI